MEPNEIKRETAAMKCNNGNIYMKKMKLTRIERESEIDCGKMYTRKK